VYSRATFYSGLNDRYLPSCSSHFNDVSRLTDPCPGDVDYMSMMGEDNRLNLAANGG
jgi:hypothetical protein